MSDGEDFISFTRIVAANFDTKLRNANALADSQGTFATSQDHAIEIEIDGRSHVTDISIDPDHYYEIDVDELAESILETYHAALDKLSSTQISVFKRTFGGSK